LSFLSGNNNDSLGVLALSTATAIAIVRYAIPAWRNRQYIQNRWLVWTGPSRTGIESRFRDICGNAEQWERIAQLSTNKRVGTTSDDWGPAINSPKGLLQDPTDLLLGIPDQRLRSLTFGEGAWPEAPGIFNDGIESSSVSLLWGEDYGFRRRVSRAILSMPLNLLQSRPFTIDGYNGEGLCLAMGILGRTKGLQPWLLVFDVGDELKKARGYGRIEKNHKITAELENTSTWYPRPNKVMRSYYAKAMKDQFEGLGPHYVAAATELSLIFLDCLNKAIRTWIDSGLEQQSMEVNHSMTQRPRNSQQSRELDATPKELHTLYRAHFVSTIISLNYFPTGPRADRPARPDLICFALLYLAEGAVSLQQAGGITGISNNTGPVNRKDDKSQYVRGSGAEKPLWWNQIWVRDRLTHEVGSLSENFRQPTAWLLGLQDFPHELLSKWPEWPQIIYDPKY